MDNIYRLKIKIGQHEFEAEGDPEVVREQFQVFKELVALSPVIPSPQTQSEARQESQYPQSSEPKLDLDNIDQRLDKIMRVENRIVSLTVRARNAEDAVLLLLYGQRYFRSNDAVTGAEIMEGLTSTGGLAVSRTDRLLEKLGRDGDVIVIGERRSKRYRLTNAGLAKARQIANELLSIVA